MARLAGIEPTTLGFGGQTSRLCITSAPDPTHCYQRKKSEDLGKARKENPRILDQNLDHVMADWYRFIRERELVAGTSRGFDQCSQAGANTANVGMPSLDLLPFDRLVRSGGGLPTRPMQKTSTWRSSAIRCALSSSTRARNVFDQGQSFPLTEDALWGAPLMLPRSPPAFADLDIIQSASKSSSHEDRGQLERPCRVAGTCPGSRFGLVVPPTP